MSQSSGSQFAEGLTEGLWYYMNWAPYFGFGIQVPWSGPADPTVAYVPNPAYVGTGGPPEIVVVGPSSPIHTNASRHSPEQSVCTFGFHL
jgi:hypothetical protein